MPTTRCLDDRYDQCRLDGSRHEADLPTSRRASFDCRLSGAGLGDPGGDAAHARLSRRRQARRNGGRQLCAKTGTRLPTIENRSGISHPIAALTAYGHAAMLKKPGAVSLSVVTIKMLSSPMASLDPLARARKKGLAADDRHPGEEDHCKQERVRHRHERDQRDESGANRIVQGERPLWAEAIDQQTEVERRAYSAQGKGAGGEDRLRRRQPDQMQYLGQPIDGQRPFAAAPARAACRQRCRRSSGIFLTQHLAVGKPTIGDSSSPFASTRCLSDCVARKVKQNPRLFARHR
jgi:hypothetical protein